MRTSVGTSAGPVQGSEHDGVARFLGVPYAAPPFGERRFAAPQPTPPWEDVLDCRQYGPTATRAPYAAPLDLLLPEPVIEGEAILNLNIWTPDPDAGGLPVLVWIHGGAFVNGSGAVPQYDGAAFARDGVVAVTINYRLGVDGFLHFDDDGPHNRGLLDQVAALQWVKAEIAAFGGDPERVTVAGESAGAFSVGALLAMPGARGLFRRAVLQSGAGHHALSSATAKRVAQALGEELGVPPTRQALAEVPLARVHEAQQALTTRIATAPDPARWGEITLNLMAFEPVIDGDVLPDLPIRAVEAGAAADVDVLVGSTTQEYALFLVPSGLVDLIDEPTLTLLATAYGLSEQALQLYRDAAPGAAPGELLSAVATDWFFRVPGLRLAEARAGERTWVYEFAWRSPRFDGRLGACHALEIPFTFDTLRTEGAAAMGGEDPPQALADAMHRAWVAFVTDGDPGWPAYDLQVRPTRVFDETISTVDDPRPAQRRVWEGARV